jgi:hypothetical protein
MKSNEKKNEDGTDTDIIDIDTDTDIIDTDTTTITDDSNCATQTTGSQTRLMYNRTVFTRASNLLTQIVHGSDDGGALERSVFDSILELFKEDANYQLFLKRIERFAKTKM